MKSTLQLHRSLATNPAVHACTTFRPQPGRAVAVAHAAPGQVFGTTALPAQGNRVHPTWDHAWHHAGYDFALSAFAQGALNGQQHDIAIHPDQLNRPDRIFAMQSDSTHLSAEQIITAAQRAAQIMATPFVVHFDTEAGVSRTAMRSTIEAFAYHGEQLLEVPGHVVFAIHGSAAHYTGLVNMAARMWQTDSVATHTHLPFAEQWHDRANALLRHAPGMPLTWHARAAHHHARRTRYAHAVQAGFAFSPALQAEELPALIQLRKQLDTVFTDLKLSELLQRGENIQTGWGKDLLMTALYRPLQDINFAPGQAGTPLSAIETCRQVCGLSSKPREQSYYTIERMGDHYVIQDRLTRSVPVTRSSIGLPVETELFTPAAFPNNSGLAGIPVGTITRDSRLWNETLIVLDDTPLPDTAIVRRDLIRLMAQEDPIALYEALTGHAPAAPAHDLATLHQALLERGIISPHAIARSGLLGNATLFAPDRRPDALRVISRDNSSQINFRNVHREPLPTAGGSRAWLTSYVRLKGA